MKQKRQILSIVFVICIHVMGLQAQEAIPASGGNASDSGGNVSYSIGQVFYTTNIGVNGSVSEGVQQAIEIKTIDGVENASINLFCKAYPNPATNFLTLNVENYDKENLSYQLVDLNGKSIEINKITGSDVIISVADLVPGIYFLRISNQLQEIKTFQIIKK